MHPNETANRLAKAKRLLAFILDRTPNATPSSLNLMERATWNMWASAAGEEPPSDLTIAQVVALLQGRQDAIEAIREQMGRVR